MNYVLAAIMGLIGWFVLMLITTNIVGMVVRGFFSSVDDQKKKGDVASIIFGIIGFVFLYLLFRYVGYGAHIAAILLMIGRIPDLIWEIKNGKKITAKVKKNTMDYVTASFDWIALALVIWNAYTIIGQLSVSN